MFNNPSSIKYFVGSSKATEWAGVYNYTPQILSEFITKGEMTAIISLSSPPSFDSERAGNLVLDYLHEIYFGSEKNDTLECLEDSLYASKKRLIELVEGDESSLKEGIEFNLALVIKKGEYLYIGVIGETKVYGQREGNISELSSILKDPDGKGVIKVGSLVLKPGDTFLLLTPEADFEIKEDARQKMMDDFSLQYLHAKNLANESLVAALVMKVEEKSGGEKHPKTESLSENLYKTKSTKVDEFEKEVLLSEADEVIIDEDAAKPVLKERVNIKGTNFGTIFRRISESVNKISYKRNGKTFEVVSARAIGFLLNLFKTIQKYIWFKVLAMGDNNKGGIYIRGKKNGLNYRPIIVLGVLFILMLYFVITTVKRNKEVAEHKFEMEQRLNQIEDQKNTLSDRISSVVNTQDREDEKTDLYNQVSSAERELESVDLFEERKAGIQDELKKLEDKILRRVRVDDPQIIKDFGVIEGTIPSDIDMFESRLFISDQGNGIIYSIDFQGGDMKRIAENLKSPNTIAASSAKELVFVVDNQERALGKVTLEENVVALFPGITKERLGNVTAIKAYEVSQGDHRVYAVRGDSKEVIQMTKSTDSYGLPNIRLQKDDFSKLLDIDIYDGRIYLISEGQGVRRFYGDELTNLVKGFINQDNWNGASCLYVDKKYLYVGDNMNKRLLIFSKSRGEDITILDFLVQYDLKNALDNSDIIDIVADAETNSIFVLSGTKVLRIGSEQIQSFDY